MTNCNSKPIRFSSIKSKKVEAHFSGGDITSDGGLLLLRQVDKKYGLTRALAKTIQDPRHPGYISHSIEHMLRQRVFAIAAGYEDINDHDTLAKDPCLQLAVGREANLASSATLSRFENSLNRHALVAMSQVLVEHFIAKQQQAPDQLVLDFDPTDNKIHGHQSQRHYHGYYNEYCFLPLHVFCGDDLLVSLLRPSNIDGAKYAGAVLKLLVKWFRQVWPEVNIVFRGDCAFARKRILSWCERNQVAYITGISGNKRLQKQAKELAEKAESDFNKTHEKQRVFEAFNYQAGSWKHARRVLVKIEHEAKGSNQRYLVTNLSGEAKVLYEQWYCPRGDMENGIKQLKLDMHSDRNSCRSFLANQFRLMLSSIAYVLVNDLRQLCLHGTRLAKAYCGTIRLKLLKIGAVILRNTRRVQFLLSTNHPYQAEFMLAATRLVPT